MLIDRSDLAFLHEMGAHFVLCNSQKRAIQKGWQKRENRPSIDTAWHHAERGANLLGLIPASLGLFVIDVDEGDPVFVTTLLGTHEVPLRLVKTPNGHHIYCFAPEGGAFKGNAKWSFAGCKGDIRYDAGYVVVYDGFEAAIDLAEFAQNERVPLKPATLIELLNKPAPPLRGGQSRAIATTGSLARSKMRSRDLTNRQRRS